MDKVQNGRNSEVCKAYDVPLVEDADDWIEYECRKSGASYWDYRELVGEVIVRCKNNLVPKACRAKHRFILPTLIK